MKFSEKWLREWADPAISHDALLQQLTMAGFEVDAVEPIAYALRGVVVGFIQAIKPHPQANNLRVCQVEIENNKMLTIVCGDLQLPLHAKVPVALVGAQLGPHQTIKKTKMHGVSSEGMLCSLADLGMAESADCVWVLPPDAPLGKSLVDYLHLEDKSITLDITPNRGDCLSVRGIAREVSVLNRLTLPNNHGEPVTPQSEMTFPIQIEATQDCPRYVGRVIEHIDPEAKTPLWLVERLRRSGIRSLGPVVDVTNYALLELGQPLHAFDLDTLHDGIIVRRAQAKETLTLLDGQTVKLRDDILVIADHKNPLAIAGIMGGLGSSVTAQTRRVFLESAFFQPRSISGRARHFGLHTESSHRFERGVDITMTTRAIERATQLLLDIVGGVAGPVTEQTTEDAARLSEPKLIPLRYQRIERVLGFSIPEDDILSMCEHFGFSVFSQGEWWEVTVPAYRFDLSIEEDLIEEIVRIHGYDKLPTRKPMATLGMKPLNVPRQRRHDAQRFLVSQGYHEAITYSFVDPNWQTEFHVSDTPINLLNPISQELSQMRMSLWPGLLQAVQYNQRRQQEYIRLFEYGLCFQRENDGVQQIPHLAGLAVGTRWPEQWGSASHAVDYYDVRHTVSHVLHLLTGGTAFEFVPTDHVALHPGQSACIMHADQRCGYVGMLHPRIQQGLELPEHIGLFEINLDNLSIVIATKFTALSKYPSIRRDLSFFIAKTVTAQEICATVKHVANDLLKSVQVFDIYAGSGVPAQQKSVGLALILQHPSRTLIDEDISAIVTRVVSTLQQTFAITLRD